MEKIILATRDDLLRTVSEFGGEIIGDPPPPSGYGYHPRAMAETAANRLRLRELSKQARSGLLINGEVIHISPELYERLYIGKRVPLTMYHDERHPAVTLLPAWKQENIVDHFSDPIGFERMRLWFGSFDFFIQEDSWLEQVLCTPPFWRMGSIVQLGNLVAPLPIGLRSDQEIVFLGEPFRHTRWIHSRLAAAMAEVLLARLGFSSVERASIVLAIAYHDIAIPAGGDAIKRIDPWFLNEERNFAWVLQQYGLDKKWERQYGFDLQQAAAWVRNEGMPGFLLDFLDKLSYVTLDCHALGLQRDGQTRRFCLEHQLFADVWLDLQCSEDRHRLAFTDPRRLCNFLMARAHASSELYYNPFARTYDYLLTEVVGELYKHGLVTWQNLVTWSQDELLRVIEKKSRLFHSLRKLLDTIPNILEPQQLDFRWFPTEEERDAFAATLGDRLHHRDKTKPFTTCLDWPVFTDPDKRLTTAPLHSFLSDQQIFELEWLARSRAGYYVYYRK